MGRLQYIVVQENQAPQAQGRKMSLGTAQIPATLESAIYAAWPQEAPAPPPPPAPPPLAPGAVLVSKGDRLKDRVAQVKPGGHLLLERGGVWNEPLALSSTGHDGITIGNFGNGPLPKINATFGVMLYGPQEGVTISGLHLLGTPNTDGYGVQALTQAIRNLTFIGNVVQGFRMNMMFQHPASAIAAPLNEWHRNLMIQGNLFLDSRGSGERDGQGLYLETVDGLLVSENLIDGAGMNRKNADGSPNYSIFAHGMYIQAGNKRTRILRNVVARCESYGIQARGPDIRRPGEDTSDPGSDVRDNIMYDCAIGFTIDAGTRGTATGNYVIPGHFHTPQYHHGQGCGIIHCGGGDFSGNVRLDGPTPDPNRHDWRMPFVDLSVDGTDSTHPWRWTLPVGGNTQGRDFIGKGVFLDPSARLAVARATALRGDLVDVGVLRDQIAADIEGVVSRANGKPPPA